MEGIRFSGCPFVLQYFVLYLIQDIRQTDKSWARMTVDVNHIFQESSRFFYLNFTNEFQEKPMNKRFEIEYPGTATGRIWDKPDLTTYINYLHQESYQRAVKSGQSDPGHKKMHNPATGGVFLYVGSLKRD